MIPPCEYEMVMDELRDDPAFVDRLAVLNERLSLALRASHPAKRKSAYAGLAHMLAEIVERMDDKR
jgi:hypothetical protein